MQAFILAAAAVSALGVDVGWQKTDNGEMEYIIQLEPHQVKTLKKGDVIEVGVRPDLRNVRRYRIVVGEDELPQESAAPKLTIGSPAYSAKPLERPGDFSIVVPKNAKGQPLWSEPAISPGRSSQATFEEPEIYGADATSSSGVADAADSHPDTTAPPDDAGTFSAVANEDSRYDTIPPAGAADTVAADDTTSGPTRFIDPPSFRANPYAPQDSATAQGTASAPPPANAPANQYVPGDGTRYPPLDDSAYGSAPSDVSAPAATNATNAATVADPQLGTRYSNTGNSTYSAPTYAGSTSFQRPGETSAPPPPPRTLVTEMPGADPARVAAAFAPANTTPGLQTESASSPKKSNDEPSDGQSSAGDSPKPWALFTVTLFALFASLGGNLYLGWMNWDMRQRFRSLIRRMKLGDSKGRATNDDMD